MFSCGNQICADSVVVSGSVEVNESLLTGESDAIIKKPGDLLFSGSFVVSGKCRARVDKVGKDNYIERLSVELFFSCGIRTLLVCDLLYVYASVLTGSECGGEDSYQKTASPFVICPSFNNRTF